jgi:MoaA/NifB/PqqE/SkfB family radical SAM enzyme
LLINPEGKLLRHIDRIAGWQRGERPAPVTVEIDLSNRCPLGCDECHYAHTHVKGPWTRVGRTLPLYHDKGGDLMDMTVLDNALLDMSLFGVKSVVWSGGGEPTSHPQWQAAVALAASYGLQQGMYTYGGEFARVQDAPALAAAHLAWVVVSLDWHTAALYAKHKRVAPSMFEAACEGVGRLSAAHATVGASFLVNAENWTDMAAMLQLGRDLGASYTTFRPAITTSPAAPGVPLGDRSWVAVAYPTLRALSQQPGVECNPQRFLDWATWTGHGYTTCAGPCLSTAVTPDGRVWICTNRREYTGSSLGDLRKQTFREIWASHPGGWDVDNSCRAMCKLHPVNERLNQLVQPLPHEEFL